MILDFTPPTGRLVAPVRPFTACVQSLMNARHGPAVMVDLLRAVDRGELAPGKLIQVREDWAGIDELAAAHLASGGISPDFLAGTEMPEAVPDSDEISAALAADLLDVTQRRVRQMIAEGILPGRMVRRHGCATWVTPRQAVLRARTERARWIATMSGPLSRLS